jgi:hypothetical protein
MAENNNESQPIAPSSIFGAFSFDAPKPEAADDQT